jgi:hypothetical protein
MDKAIVTITFDDGRRDNYKVAKELLDRYEIPATFYIVTAFIENKKQIGKNGPLSREEMEFLVNNDLFEIAVHSDYHTNDFNDIRVGANKLRDWYKNLDELGFASPHSEMDKDQVVENKELWKELNIKYVRIGNNFRKFYWPEKIIAKLAKMTKSKLLFRLVYRSSFMDTTNDYALVCVPIMNENTFEQIKSLIDSAVKLKKWVILSFHTIGFPDDLGYNSMWCWDYYKFEKLCQYLSELKNNGKLSVLTAMDSVKKMELLC